jgi:hypothetical protein
MASDHDDGGVRELISAHADEVETVHIADSQIHDDEIGLVGTNGGNAVDTRGAAKDLMPSGFAELGHELQDGGFVVYDY